MCPRIRARRDPHSRRQTDLEVFLGVAPPFLSQRPADLAIPLPFLLFLFLGNLLQEKQMEQKAIAAYERALTLRPDHADIHNNLAWLLLSARDSSLLDPGRALKLATKAVAIKEEGYILDTLAVALWANGQNEKAIQAEQRAIQLDPQNRAYYALQAEKIASQNWPGRNN